MQRSALILVAVLTLTALGAIVAASVVFAIGAAFYALTVLSWEALVGVLLAFVAATGATALIHQVVWPFACRQWD